MYRSIRTSLICAFFLLASCSKTERLPTAPATEIASADVASEQCRINPRGDAQVIGQTHSGAIYALYRPAHWNGDLVVYAHGYIVPGAPIALPTNDDTEALRDRLLAHGFGVAYSSFAENGLAVRDGIRQTDALPERFARRLGHPRRVYLAGHSLGGLVIVALAERRPCRYDGVLSFSGLIGGSRDEIAYFANVRVLFDYFYPGVLPGDLMHLPGDLDLNRDMIGPAVAAMSAHPEGAFAISQLAQTPVPFSNGEELVASIVQALVFQAIELGDLLHRTGGESFFDNSSTVYTGALPPPLLADLNARVARYHMSHRVAEFFEREYEPSGRLEIPMLALHNTLDPVVPLFNETTYHDRVAAHGRPDLLVQRAIDHYGHAGFSPDLMFDSFEDLVAWVEKGARPSSTAAPASMAPSAAAAPLSRLWVGGPTRSMN